MAGFSPWVAQMNQQAQDVSSAAPMDGSTPEEQMASQVAPSAADGLDPEDYDVLATFGKQAAAQNPSLVKKAIEIKQRGPMSQEAVPYDTMMRDLAAQYDKKSKAAMNQQALGTQQMEADYNQLKRMPTQTDLVPFASMAKFLNPENDFVDAAKSMRGETPEQKAEKLFALQNMLQQRKENMSKQQLAALKEQIDAYKASKVDPLDVQMKLSKIGFYGQGRQNLQDQRLAEAAHKGILSNIEHNKPMQTKLQQIQGIDNAGKIIEDAPVVTPQIFDDYQQALVSAINRGNSGIGERAKRYMHSMGIGASEIQQYVSGKPVEIPKGKENQFYQVMQDFAKTERANIGKQYNDILDAASEGQGRWYKKNPEMKADLLSKIKAYKGMTEPSDSSSPPKAGDVQDGWMFKGGDPSDPKSWEKQ